MSNSFTLDDIRAAAEAKYGAVPITLSDGSVCKLLNPLRLSKEKRAKLTELSKENKDAESVDDSQEQLEGTIRIVAERAVLAEQLIEEVGGDLAVLATILEKYNEGAQVGEASPSQD
ncbi:phage tail assembly protein [Kribbella sindirgiensis]|uniref:Tail assembly chaperone n=1 Tax=Kribbella sindirgiensis TaxID=1124744 RepID=A0A4R0IBR4_9ACTN|nr:phage tail assembly protein [Kribbella sindirgiensis]TCC19962.1 hypothetical protein E0H50_37695 [Kribbella sindirgiensis]